MLERWNHLLSTSLFHPNEGRVLYVRQRFVNIINEHNLARTSIYVALIGS